MIAIEIPREPLRAFCRKWQVTEFSLFGSVTRPDFRPDSDIDVIVAFSDSARWSLLDLVDMKDELEVVFGRQIDLLTRYGIEKSPNLRRREAILKSAVQLDVA